MKKFYVSLTRDLLSCYLAFEADTEMAVRIYLAHTYLKKGMWTLPWCSIYEAIPQINGSHPIIIPSKCGFLLEKEMLMYVVPSEEVA